MTDLNTLTKFQCSDNWDFGLAGESLAQGGFVYVEICGLESFPGILGKHFFERFELFPGVWI